MKHGDKEKRKASKAAGKKSSEAAHKASQKVATKSQKQTAGAKSAGKAAGNGKAQPRSGGDGGGFTNPLVASAFKRAVKKYPNTFKRLSD